MHKVAVSLLNVKNSERAKISNKLISAGLQWIHYDVMDGLFVPNKAISIEEIRENILKTKKHIVDIHLMVQSPSNWIEKVKDIADYVTFHHESENYEIGFEIIKNYSNQLKIGVAINPKTNVEQIFEYLPHIHHILVMSVQPGKGGQKFNNNSIEKVSKLRKYIDQRNLDVTISVDGGINDKSAALVFAAGADIVVSGSWLVKNPTKSHLNKIQNFDIT